LTGALPIIISCKALAQDEAATLKHEKSHAVMSAFQGALKITTAVISDSRDSDDDENWANKTEFIWGGEATSDYIFRSLVAKIEKKYTGENLTTENLLEDPDVEKLMHISLSGSKDEILAYMSEEQAPNFIISVLLGKNGGYDYFKKANVPNELHDILWKEYSNRLMEYMAGSMKLYADYKIDPVFSQRIQSFRWVLAQIPIEHWNNQLASMPFDKEVTEYDGLKTELYKKYTEADSKDDDNSKEAIKEKFQRLILNVRDHCFDRTIFEDIADVADA
jgi:C-terminal processing protease CtpA/Prc